MRRDCRCSPRRARNLLIAIACSGSGWRAPAEHLEVTRTLDIAARHDYAGPAPGAPRPLLQQRGERRGSGALGELVRVVEAGAHGRGDFFLLELDEAIRAAADQLHGRGIGLARGDPVRESLRA